MLQGQAWSVDVYSTKIDQPSLQPTYTGSGSLDESLGTNANYPTTTTTTITMGTGQEDSQEETRGKEPTPPQI
jgi:hypothetical protein